MKEEISPERWKQIDRLLDSILELEPGQRNAYLEKLCAGDEALKKQIESLLQSDEPAQNLLQQPAYQAAAELITQPAISAGQNIGRYTILSAVASGGMGEVYRAMDPLIGREVAVKVLPAHHMQDEERLRRFEQEARAAGMLNHANIIAIYDVGKENGFPYLVTELLHGHTVRQLMNSGALSLSKKMEYAIQIVKGLSVAHEQGIIHRDLKPENLFVTKEDQVKILDFGLAKLTERSQIPRSDLARSKTQTGMVMGTAVYMSPEQIRGGKIDYRSDIFSFGSVLYEWITGNAPFTGESEADVMSSILKSDPPPFELRETMVSSDLQRIVLRCLEKEPERRFQSSRDLTFALEALVPHLDSAQLKRTNWNRKSIAIFGLLAALIGALFAFVVTRDRSAKIISPGKEPYQEMKIVRLTTIGKIFDAAISPDGKHVSYVIKEGDAQSLWVRQVATTSNVQILPPSMSRFRGITFSTDGNFIYYVVSPPDNPRGTAYQIPALGGLPTQLHDDVYSPIAVSPDNTSLAFIGRDALIVSDTNGQNLRYVAHPRPEFSFGSSPSWSPDGRRIAVVLEDAGGFHDQLVTIDVETGQETPVTFSKWFDIERLSWLSDGAEILMIAKEEEAGYRNYQAWRISYPDGKVSRITNDLNEYRSLSATADSKTLITVRLEQTSNIWLLDPSNSNPKQITSGAGSLDGVWGLSWTQDEKILYTSIASGNEDLWLMRSDGKGPTQLTRSTTSKVGPSVCSDGLHAVYMTRTRTGTDVWRIGVDGSNPSQLTQRESGGVPNCGGDGDWIYYVATRTGKWNLCKISLMGGDPVPLNDHPSLSPVVSPDGTMLAYAFLGSDRKKKIAVISAEGGPPIGTLPLSPTASIDIGVGLHWTKDGKGIVFADTINGVSNLWVQQLKGGTAEQLTHFESEEIFSYDVSRSGKIAVARGNLARDVVLISNYR